MNAKSILLLLAGVIAGIAGTMVFIGHQNPPPVPAPEVQTAPVSSSESEPASVPTHGAAPKQDAPRSASEAAVPAAPMAVATPAPAAGGDTNQVAKSVDDLLGAKNGQDKHNLFQQLGQAGQIDAVIADLKQRATANPNDPEIPTTLGEAMLNKLKAMRDSGSGDYSEIGIMAMQADQEFNAALKIDPQNWEAQFVKSASMYYWPSSAQTDNDVVQHLSSLIDQQDTMAAQPEFAQSYVVLGDEYQKLGQQDKAVATWQLGAQKFPSDATLQKRINGQ